MVVISGGAVINVGRASTAFREAFNLYRGEGDGLGMAEVALEAVREPNPLDEQTLAAMLETALEANRDGPLSCGPGS